MHACTSSHRLVHNLVSYSNPHACDHHTRPRTRINNTSELTPRCRTKYIKQDNNPPDTHAHTL